MPEFCLELDVFVHDNRMRIRHEKQEREGRGKREGRKVYQNGIAFSLPISGLLFIHLHYSHLI